MRYQVIHLPTGTIFYYRKENNLWYSEYELALHFTNSDKTLQKIFYEGDEILNTAITTISETYFDFENYIGPKNTIGDIVMLEEHIAIIELEDV